MNHFFSAAILALTLYTTAQAQRVDLEAYASGFDSIPVAILKFRPVDGPEITSDEPWRIIANDLDFSGRFHVVKSKMIDTAKFNENNVGIFIDGEYSVKEGKVVLDCYLHDATTMDLLVGKKYQGETKYLRKMSHRYSNAIMELFLGTPGPFESKILFVKDLGATKNLSIMDFDGAGGKQLTTTTTVNVFPVFFDSTQVVWTSFFRGKPDLYKGSISSGTSNIFIYSRYVETSPAVSDVIGRMAYASSRKGNLDIYTCDTYGKDRKQLTFNRAIDTSPTWSPNGYQIAFTSDRSGNPQIYVMDSDGVNTRRLTFQGKYQDAPSWSPLGDKIAYTSYQNGKFDIWVIDVDGANAKRVTTIPGNNEYPTWSPDGSHIAFASGRGGKSDIYSIRPDGTGVKRITALGNAKMPDWSSF